MDTYLQRAHDLLQETAGHLPVSELARKPVGKWSTAEIIEHLARAFSGTARGVQRVLDAGRPAARRPSLRERLTTFIVIDGGYFPTGRESPKVAKPRGVDPAAALALACDNLRQMDEALHHADARFGRRVLLLDHPILGPLNVRQWRKLHWIHTRHHARQIAARQGR